MSWKRIVEGIILVGKMCEIGRGESDSQMRYVESEIRHSWRPLIYPRTDYMRDVASASGNGNHLPAR
jgi:hypothetical protein